MTVPFGGAFVTVVGVMEIWKLCARAIAAGTPMPDHSGRHHFKLSAAEIYVILLLGLFLLGIVNSARFRTAIAGFFSAVFATFHLLVIEPIRWIARWPLLQRFFRSPLFILPFRFLIKPLFWTAAIWLLFGGIPFWEIDPRASFGTGASVFLAVNLLLNSRLGRTAEEVLADWIVQGWRRFGLRLMVGIFWFFIDVFRSIVEAVERLIYSVNEWLRFRTGEGRLWAASKATMGALWFFVAYVLRFAVNVLLEPQFNPIKHFPVVTVAHKLLFPFYKPFADLLMAKGLGEFAAWGISFGTIWGIPGIFGFLVWELKENWRLYAANRRVRLAPVMIGAHGETMGRLLRPGFHSGTLPKRYAKLRVAERHARQDGGWRAVHKHLRALGRIELLLRRYVERELLELFAESRCWGQAPPQIEELLLGANSVRLSLRCDAAADAPLRIAIDAESGWLLAGVASAGWAGRLPLPQRLMLTTALLGLYKTAGIDLVRQQIESEFPPPLPPYDVSAAGLLLWPDEREDVEVLYDLHEGPWIAPQQRKGDRSNLWRSTLRAVPANWTCPLFSAAAAAADARTRPDPL